MPNELPASIREAGDLLRAGRLTSLDLVEACLARIERFDARVRAWVMVDADGARAQARRLDDELHKGGPRHPLHGIPIGIKDIIDVEGWPTLAGSRLRAGHVARQDAPIVRRLRAAGAVILGKTVTTEFASFDPPPTRNPWNLERTPAGSSSGSAAAVALGMCMAAVGSQTGGSITRPAGYCGVAGCKPTYGLVSLSGIVSLAYHMDHPGPIAPRVSDLAIMLASMAGYEPLDPFSVDVPVPDYAAGLERAAPPRLGLMTGFFRDAASDEVRAVVAASIERLRAAGATVEEMPPPASFADVIVNHRRIMGIEAAEYHRANFPARRSEYGPQLASLLDEALATSVLDYAAALKHKEQFTRDLEALAGRYDALVTPATTTTAPTPETTGDPRFNAPFSYANCPTVCFPCGVARDGLPVGLQLIGRHWGEGPLLAVSAWCERAIGFAARPPLVAECDT
ncbi:MAG: amidase [Planctomycetia bacterium]|nr:amidase [Planctomycetia bacterium]